MTDGGAEVGDGEGIHLQKTDARFADVEPFGAEAFFGL